MSGKRTSPVPPCPLPPAPAAVPKAVVPGALGLEPSVGRAPSCTLPTVPVTVSLPSMLVVLLMSPSVPEPEATAGIEDAVVDGVDTAAAAAVA